MKWFDDEIEKEFERMRKRMERTLGSLSRPGTAMLLTDTGWRPSLDLYETADDFLVLVAVAGIQPKDVEVVVERDILRISGNRNRPLQQGITRVHQMEIDFGPFNHAVRLPEPVVADTATSSYRDGFLTIRLPKQARVSGSITVKVSE